MMKGEDDYGKETLGKSRATKCDSDTSLDYGSVADLAVHLRKWTKDRNTHESLKERKVYKVM